jgi:hypothetical protein
VRRETHHVVALDAKGEQLHDAALPPDDAKLRVPFDKLAWRGRAPIVIDQPATIGALARDGRSRRRRAGSVDLTAPFFAKRLRSERSP